MLEQFLPQLIKTRGWLHATHATYHIQLSRCQVAGRWDKRGQWLLAARQALSINDYSQGDSPSHKSQLMTIERHHTHTSILISTQTVRVPWNLPIFQRVPTHTHTKETNTTPSRSSYAAIGSIFSWVQGDCVGICVIKLDKELKKFRRFKVSLWKHLGITQTHTLGYRDNLRYIHM